MINQPQLSQIPIWLGGTLANHRRGRVLKTVINAQPLAELAQTTGLVLLFGSDFQEASESEQAEWVKWSQASRHVLLLIPPFKSISCQTPTEWTIKRQSKPMTATHNAFLNELAAEVQYQVSGNLQTTQLAEHSWDDASLCTGYYRKHPYSGIFAITCLPLWSLIMLDRETEFRAWISQLFELVNNGQAEVEITPPASFIPTPEHFTSLLHLLTSTFDSDESAINALQASSVFSLSQDQANQALKELQAQHLIDHTQVTEAGRILLIDSPYACYAQELERLR